MEGVKLEKQGPVGVITIARPEALNALNTAVLAELKTAFDEAEADDALNVVINHR